MNLFVAGWSQRKSKIKETKGVNDVIRNPKVSCDEAMKRHKGHIDFFPDHYVSFLAIVLNDLRIQGVNHLGSVWRKID